MRSKSNNGINKKTKLHIKFDADDRRDYLKGFRKRKEERRVIAKQEAIEKVKNEKKIVRQKQRDMMKKMMNQCVMVDADNSDSDVYQEKEEKDENVKVNEYGAVTVEIKDLDLSTSSSHIGNNEGLKSYRPHTDVDPLSETLVKTPKQLIKSMFRNAKNCLKKEKSQSKHKKKMKESKKSKLKKKGKVLVTQL